MVFTNICRQKYLWFELLAMKTYINILLIQLKIECWLFIQEELWSFVNTSPGCSQYECSSQFCTDKYICKILHCCFTFDSGLVRKFIWSTVHNEGGIESTFIYYNTCSCLHLFTLFHFGTDGAIIHCILIHYDWPYLNKKSKTICLIMCKLYIILVLR